MDPDKHSKIRFKSKIFKNENKVEPVDKPAQENKAHPVLIGLAILIPLLVLGFILYMNFLPFGYSKTYTIEVGSPSDTSGVFYLEQSPSLGARQMIDDVYFRAVDGVVNVVYAPTPILRNVTVQLSLEGDGVYFITQPDISNITWDYDFVRDVDMFEVVAPHTVFDKFLNGSAGSINGTFAVVLTYNATAKNTLITGDLNLTQDAKNVVVSYYNNNTLKQIKYALPDYYVGKEHSILVGYNSENIYLFVDSEFAAKDVADMASIKKINVTSEHTIYSNYVSPIKETIPKDINGCLIFDGKTRLVLPNSSDSFEDGPFSVYVEWTPESQENYQQLLGHYNWEVWQNRNNVRFQVGRMYDGGPSYAVAYPIDSTFFNQTHNLLAVYNPSELGHIELYVDGIYAGRTEFGNETIWKDYGNIDLSLGWTPHNYGKSSNYIGAICNSKFSYKKVIPEKSILIEANFTRLENKTKTPIFGNGNLNKVKINIIKN